jgi:pyruvate formate lyase activating enzyme
VPRRRTSRAPPATLIRAHDIARSYGLRYVYTGNVHDPARGSTHCPACDALLIGRDWYTLTAWNLTPDGRCRACNARCAGVFDGAPGRWGARRLPVRLADVASESFAQ